MTEDMRERQASSCPSCGYTKRDQQIHGDHHLCKNAGNAPWEKRGPMQAALSSAGTSGRASAPDRAGELVQDKFAELRSFLTNMRRDAADAEDPELSEYAQAIEQRLDELASLLREAMGRVKCDHEPYQGRCVHCNVEFRNGVAAAPPREEG